MNAPPIRRKGDGTSIVGQGTGSSRTFGSAIGRFRLSIMAVAIMLLLTGISAFLLPENSNRDNADVTVDATAKVDSMLLNIRGELDREASASLVRHISGGTRDILTLEDLVKADMDGLVSGSMDPYPTHVEGYEAHVDTVSIDIREGGALLQLPTWVVRQETGVTEVSDSIDTTTLELGDVGVPGLYTLEVKAKLRLKEIGKEKLSTQDAGTGGESVLDVSVSRTLFVPLGALEALEGHFSDCAMGRYSDVGSMMAFMLNTVTRYRASIGWGMDSDSSPRNILNEGDVELALNLAVLLEELMLTGTYDTTAAANVDSAFFYVSLPASGQVPVNPTDHREWSTSERQNFARYKEARQAVNPLGRTLANILADHDDGGYLDPADILMLYLCLDNCPGPSSLDIDPSDAEAVLTSQQLMDPRYPNFLLDLNDLLFRLVVPGGGPDLTSYSGPVGGDVGDDGARMTNTTDLKVRVDQTPNFLVDGRDFMIEGMFPPDAWCTSGIVNTTTYCTDPYPTPAPTRCGGTKPGERPPMHDFRLQWDLHIKGRFTVNLTETSDISPVSGSGVTVSRQIELDLPITVLAWIPSMPSNSVVNFRDLNKGTMYMALNVSIWIIDPESNATEYFSEFLWRAVEPVMAVAWDEVALLERLGLQWGREGTAQRLDRPGEMRPLDIRMAQEKAYLNAYSSTDAFGFIRTFVDDFLDAQNITTAKLKEISVGMSNVTLDYSHDTDTLSMTVEHNRYSPRLAQAVLVYSNVHGEVSGRRATLHLESLDGGRASFSIDHELSALWTGGSLGFSVRGAGSDTYTFTTGYNTSTPEELVSSRMNGVVPLLDPGDGGLLAVPLEFTEGGMSHHATIWVADNSGGMAAAVTDVNRELADMGQGVGANAVDVILGRLFASMDLTGEGSAAASIAFDDDAGHISVLYGPALSGYGEALAYISARNIAPLSRGIGTGDLLSGMKGSGYLSMISAGPAGTRTLSVRPVVPGAPEEAFPLLSVRIDGAGSTVGMVSVEKDA